MSMLYFLFLYNYFFFLLRKRVKGTHLVIYLLVYFEFVLLCFVAYKKKNDVEHFRMSSNNRKS